MNTAFTEQEEIAEQHVNCCKQCAAQLVRLRAAGWKDWVGGREGQRLEQKPCGSVPITFLISFRSPGKGQLTQNDSHP